MPEDLNVEFAVMKSARTKETTDCSVAKGVMTMLDRGVSSLLLAALVALSLLQKNIQGFTIPSASIVQQRPSPKSSGHFAESSAESEQQVQEEVKVEKKEENLSYYRRFARGDFTKLLINTATDQVNEITGEEEWHAGDLARWLDAQAKERLNAVKEDDDGVYQYNYGDFTRWAKNLALERAAIYAGKTSASDYKVGDITKTIIEKVKSGEYEKKDVFLALRILLAAGFSIIPVVNVLPMQWLLSLVTVGLTKSVTGRVSEKIMGELTDSLEDRIEGALTDKVDSIKDNTKAKWNSLVSKFIGKEKYVKGDLARAIRATAEEDKPQQMADLEEIVKAMEEWDDSYVKKAEAAKKP